MDTLAEFQKRNCKGCFYADEEKVGTGQACCTYPQPLSLQQAKCLTRKEVSNRKIKAFEKS
ncbi:MAG: hypothetical protein H8E40_14760 [Chloroflexi bacterium]|nr:hypothetical protein [Chloroflexota bacterium]